MPVGAGPARQPAALSPPDIGLFFQAAARDERAATQALDRIARAWRDGYAAMVIDLARLMRPAQDRPPDMSSEPLADPTEDVESRPPFDRRDDPLQRPGAPPGNPPSRIRARLVRFLERQTGQRFGDDLARWRAWIWNRPYDPHPDYALFKGGVYGNIDERMRQFFPPGVRSAIRLDEIEWGGVPVNGIPPLAYPRHVRSPEAGYLKDHHLVFGIVVNGEARAYPKRILAWHELARDRIGGVEMTVVYCTLCGTVIPYESEVGGQVRTFGTSGLLYRSNKLMFDEESLNLWSTFEGVPVVGSLVGSDLRLRAHAVVTTTWRAWKAEHPDTTVLSLETGHKRDYAEGAAYREYFATERLMFGVPATDSRLKNKAEVLVMRLAASGADLQPVAISVDFLEKNPLYHLKVTGHDLVVVTGPGGANRVFAARGTRFGTRLVDGRIEDTAGRTWRVSEEALVRDGDLAVRLERVPAQRAFWFGWYAQFPNTILIK